MHKRDLQMRFRDWLKVIKKKKKKSQPLYDKFRIFGTAYQCIDG